MRGVLRFAIEVCEESADFAFDIFAAGDSAPMFFDESGQLEGAIDRDDVRAAIAVQAMNEQSFDRRREALERFCARNLLRGGARRARITRDDSLVFFADEEREANRDPEMIPIELDVGAHDFRRDEKKRRGAVALHEERASFTRAAERVALAIEQVRVTLGDGARAQVARGGDIGS